MFSSWDGKWCKKTTFVTLSSSRQRLRELHQDHDKNKNKKINRDIPKRCLYLWKYGCCLLPSHHQIYNKKETETNGVAARRFENIWPVICWYYGFSTGEYLLCRSAEAFSGVTFLDTRMHPRSLALSASISGSCHFLTRGGDQSLKSLYPPPVIVHRASVTPPASTCLLWPVIAPFLSICCRSPHLLLLLPPCTYLESSLNWFNTEKYDSPVAFLFIYFLSPDVHFFFLMKIRPKHNLTYIHKTCTVQLSSDWWASLPIQFRV